MNFYKKDANNFNYYILYMINQIVYIYSKTIILLLYYIRFQLKQIHFLYILIINIFKKTNFNFIQKIPYVQYDIVLVCCNINYINSTNL